MPPTRPRDPQPGALSRRLIPGPSCRRRTVYASQNRPAHSKTKCEVRGSGQVDAMKRQFLRYGSETKSSRGLR
jgi:hypothetical protein